MWICFYYYRLRFGLLFKILFELPVPYQMRFSCVANSWPLFSLPAQHSPKLFTFLGTVRKGNREKMQCAQRRRQCRWRFTLSTCCAYHIVIAAFAVTRTMHMKPSLARWVHGHWTSQQKYNEMIRIIIRLEWANRANKNGWLWHQTNWFQLFIVFGGPPWGLDLFWNSCHQNIHADVPIYKSALLRLYKIEDNRDMRRAFPNKLASIESGSVSMSSKDVSSPKIKKIRVGGTTSNCTNLRLRSVSIMFEHNTVDSMTHSEWIPESRRTKTVSSREWHK